MTDNLKTWPERIYVHSRGLSKQPVTFDDAHVHGFGWNKQSGDVEYALDVEYVRADLLESAVKAALEAAAIFYEELLSTEDINCYGEHIPEGIRNLDIQTILKDAK